MGDGMRDRRGLILLAMTVANAMVLVDQTAVPLILPSIIQRFDVGSQQVQWVLNASLLPLAGLLVFGGRLGDLIGRRRVFLLGSTVFAGASVCAGLAPTFSILLVFRVLQGAGGALMLPTTIAIVSAAYPGADQVGRWARWVALCTTPVEVRPPDRWTPVGTRQAMRLRARTQRFVITSQVAFSCQPQPIRE
jgi:MFS family permease